MKKDFISKRPSGSGKGNEPKVMSEVLNEYFESDEPLAVAFRNWKAKSEAAKTRREGETDQSFWTINRHTEPCIDLKLLTRKAGPMEVGEFLPGVITRDSEFHFSFVENADREKVVSRRTPCIYKGSCVNVHECSDGSRFATFRRPSFIDHFTFADFCREAAEELLIVGGLVEESEC